MLTVYKNKSPFVRAEKNEFPVENLDVYVYLDNTICSFVIRDGDKLA